jgi:predicted transcriptional regulator
MVDVELLSWIKRSKQRQQILKYLDKPRTPTEVSEHIDAHIAQVSHSLSNMVEKDLVEALNPDAKTGRLYRVTEKGEEMASKLC